MLSQSRRRVVIFGGFLVDPFNCDGPAASLDIVACVGLGAGSGGGCVSMIFEQTGSFRIGFRWY